MRYGTILPKWFNIPKSAFWLRADLEKRNPFETVSILKGDRIMDCGAYIGTFAAAAMEQGAGKVFCYEAAPKNAVLLRENMERYGPAVRVMEKALVPGKETTVRLTLSGFSGANSIIPSDKRQKSIEVRAVNFRTKLLKIQPQVLKLDIEGAEYDILATLKPNDLSSVRCIFIEFHPYPKREERIKAIRTFLVKEGFTVISGRNRAFTAAK